jgi:hypothetical protein
MDIQKLVDRYDDEIRVLEKRIEEFRKKRDILKDILKDATEMLNENPLSGMADIKNHNITVTSDKYANMYWPEAILLALKEGREMTAKEVLGDLLRNGFETTSKSAESDVYGRLRTLARKGKVIAIKDGKQLVRYKIKEDKQEDPDSHMDESGS